LKKKQTQIEKKKTGFQVAFASNTFVATQKNKRTTEGELSKIFDNMEQYNNVLGTTSKVNPHIEVLSPSQSNSKGSRAHHDERSLGQRSHLTSKTQEEMDEEERKLEEDR
jgi:hypothetical protein